MSDLGDYYKSMRTSRQEAAQANRQESGAGFLSAHNYAIEHDMALFKCSPQHYQLKVYLIATPPQIWLYSLYPGNQRIWPDPKHKGPFLHVKEWSFKSIIDAAQKVRAKRCKGDQNEH